MFCYSACSQVPRKSRVGKNWLLEDGWKYSCNSSFISLFSLLLLIMVSIIWSVYACADTNYHACCGSPVWSGIQYTVTKRWPRLYHRWPGQQWEHWNGWIWRLCGSQLFADKLWKFGKCKICPSWHQFQNSIAYGSSNHTAGISSILLFIAGCILFIPCIVALYSFHMFVTL